MPQGDQALGQHSCCRQYPLAIRSVILDTVVQPQRGRMSGRLRDHFQVDCVNNTELSFCSWPEISRLTKQKRNFSKPGCLTHPCRVLSNAFILNPQWSDSGWSSHQEDKGWGEKLSRSSNTAPHLLPKNYLLQILIPSGQNVTEFYKRLQATPNNLMCICQHIN